MPWPKLTNACGNSDETGRMPECCRAAVLLSGHTGIQAYRQTDRQTDTALDVLLPDTHADTVLDGREFTA